MFPRPRNTLVCSWLRGEKERRKEGEREREIATEAREKSSYTKINIRSDHVAKQSARIFVSARPSITLRIRRQTCNARSCRPPHRRAVRSLGSSRSSSRPTPRTNRRLRGNPLGIHSRLGIRPLLLQNPSVSGHRARGTITGRPIKSRRRVQSIKIMSFSFALSVEINDLLYLCRRNKHFILKLSCK